MCACLYCNVHAPCDEGPTCPNDICPKCAEERDEARRDEASEHGRDVMTLAGLDPRRI